MSFLVLALKVPHPGNPYSPGKTRKQGGLLTLLSGTFQKGSNIEEEGGKMDGDGWPWQRLAIDAEKLVGGLCCPCEVARSPEGVKWGGGR